MAVFASDKPAKPMEEEAEMNPKLETSINPLDSSSFSSSDWYLGSDSMSWSGSFGSDDDLGQFDWVSVISDSDESRSSSDEEFPVNIASIPVGFVLSVKGRKVIVEGKEKHSVLKGSFLWVTETSAPLGYVDKIFGTVRKPCFRVRFKSESQVPQGISQGAEVSLIVEDFVQQESQVPQGISQGTQVSFIDEDFVQRDKKGCDDVAPSPGDEVHEIQFSDVVKVAMCEMAKMVNTGKKKDVLSVERFEEQTVPSPKRSDSEISPVRSQAIAETVGVVPQDQPLPRMGKFVVPRRSETNQQKPYKHPMANQTSGITPPKPVSTQAPTWTKQTPNPMTYTQPRFRNRQNNNNQKPFGETQKPNTAPWPLVNSRRIRPQTQQPMQSQSLNAKPSSDRGKGLLAYHRGVGEGRGFGLGRGRVQDKV